MKTAIDVMLAVGSVGGHLGIAGKKLRMLLPADCSPELKSAIREHKAELLAWLSRPPPGWQAVPPGTLPLNPIMPCPTTSNRELVIGYLLRQGCNRPDVLTAWLVRRESAYYDGPGRRWDCSLHAYAAARDAVCWQLQRGED